MKTMWSVLRRQVVATGRRVGNRDEICKAIDQAAARAVTFDVFDTALRRTTLLPVDVFLLCGVRLRARGWPIDDLEDFARGRMQAERTAREAAKRRDSDETTMEEIFATWKLPDPIRRAAYDEELLTEKDVAVADPEILAAFQHCVERGIKVAFVSDTYLPAQFVGELLEAAGYSGSYLTFASSAYGKAKWSGRLYDVVSRAFCVSADEVVHVGDNIHADLIAARRSGINAFLYERPTKRSADGPIAARGEARVVASLLAGAGKVSAAGDALQTIGATVAAPLFLGFAQFVADEARRQATNVVLFCARDGAIIQRVYGRLQTVEDDLPPSSYLQVSRRALVFPTIGRLEEEERKFLTAQFAPLTVAEVLGRIGLVAEEYLDAIEAAGLVASERIKTADTAKRLDQLLTMLSPDILARANAEREITHEYLLQTGLDTVEPVAIVDIGWQGSLQKAIAQLLQSGHGRPSLVGLYFGTVSAIRSLPPNAGSAVGWFVDADEPRGRATLVQAQWAVLELLFTANQGTVLSYQRQPSGAVIARLEDTRESHTEAYAQAATQIQDAAMTVIEHYVRAFGGVKPLDIQPSDAQAGLERLCLHPTAEEARIVGDLFHIDGLGGTRSGQYIARPPKGFARLQPARVVAGFRQASWRRGYLVRMTGHPRNAAALIKAIQFFRPGFKSA